MTINITSLKRALDTLEEAYREHATQPASLLMRDGVIQRFEYTYELSWKLLKRFLEEVQGLNDVDALGRKELFRHGHESGLIEDPLRWFGYHQARNLTSHMYAEGIAQQVYTAARAFAADATQMLHALETRLK
jgi:nucleotidyltransferase substrate binding protein (TIGR01987 family)